MTDESEPKRKIIIDEDWKSQVEAERDQLRRNEQSPESPEAARYEEEGPDRLPPASFAFLVTTLATQCMAALGQVPDPIEHKPVVRKSLAKHHIDTLAMLEEKTKGNLDRPDQQMLQDVLHQLRMLYVAVQNHVDRPSR